MRGVGKSLKRANDLNWHLSRGVTDSKAWTRGRHGAATGGEDLWRASQRQGVVAGQFRVAKGKAGIFQRSLWNVLKKTKKMG